MDGPTLTPKRTPLTAARLSELRAGKLAALEQLKAEKDELLENVAANQLHLNNNIKNLRASLQSATESLLKASRATKDVGHGNTSRMLYSLREKVLRELATQGEEIPQAKGGTVPESAVALFTLAHEIRDDFSNIQKLASVEGVDPSELKSALSGVKLGMSSIEMQVGQFDLCQRYVETGITEIKEIYSEARNIRKEIESLDRTAKRQEAKSETTDKYS